MFEIVETYRTRDGVTHASVSDVKIHVENEICMAFMKAIETAKEKCNIPYLDARSIHYLTIEMYKLRADIREALLLETYGDDGHTADE